MLQKGDIVVLRVPFGKESINSHGLVFDQYNGGVQIIFSGGEYCGFSDQEQDEWVTKVCGSSLVYPFKNVLQLQNDYLSGKFNWLAWVTNDKLDNEKLKTIVFKEESESDISFSCDDA